MSAESSTEGAPPTERRALGPSTPVGAGIEGLARLDPRTIPYERTAGFIRAGIEVLLLLVLSTLALVDGWFSPTLFGVLLSAALLGIAVEVTAAIVMPPLVHRCTGYRVDDQGIEIRRGVFWRSIVTVARSRIQHLDVTQGPLERRYGLGRLQVHTAGTQAATVSLHGLTHATAKALRDDLGAWRGDADGV